MAVYLGEDEIGVVVPADNITANNILQMKVYDMAYILVNGGEYTTNEQDYIDAEAEFQELASIILGGENGN